MFAWPFPPSSLLAALSTAGADEPHLFWKSRLFSNPLLRREHFCCENYPPSLFQTRRLRLALSPRGQPTCTRARASSHPAQPAEHQQGHRITRSR